MEQYEVGTNHRQNNFARASREQSIYRCAYIDCPVASGKKGCEGKDDNNGLVLPESM